LPQECLRGKGRVKVGKLKLNKETVKDLTGREADKIRGGGSVLGMTGTCPGRGRSCP
jgi:hypothetical protein